MFFRLIFQYCVRYCSVLTHYQKIDLDFAITFLSKIYILRYLFYSIIYDLRIFLEMSKLNLVYYALNSLNQTASQMCIPERQYTRILYHFLPQNNFLEFHNSTHKFKRLFCIERPVFNAGFEDFLHTNTNHTHIW